MQKKILIMSFICTLVFSTAAIITQEKTRTTPFVNCYQELYHGQLIRAAHSRAVERKLIIVFGNLFKRTGFLVFDSIGNIYFFSFKTADFDKSKEYHSLLEIPNEGKKFSHYKWTDAEQFYWPIFSAPAIDLKEKDYDTLQRETLLGTKNKEALQILKKLVMTSISPLAQTHIHLKESLKKYPGDEHVGRGYFRFTKSSKAALQVCGEIPDLEIRAIVKEQNAYFQKIK